MKITEALESITNNHGRIKRDDWRYELYFNKDGYLTIDDGKMELSTYALSSYDFNYDWQIKE